MGYMIEISQEKQGELMEHAEKAYQHLGKMLDCIEKMGQESQMGQREDDEYYIRRFGNRMGHRGGNMGERMGRRGGGSMGYREEDGRDPMYY